MYGYPNTTPCPVSYGVPQATGLYYQNYASSLNAPYQTQNTLYPLDETGGLEYTTELQSQLRNVKPRRPLGQRRKSTFDPITDICKDGHELSQAPERKSRRVSTALREDGKRSSTILANPAQRISLVPADKHEPKREPTTRRRRVSALLEDRDAESKYEGLEGEEDRLSELKKNPRRRTIYVPSDDTTIMTIHPGAHTHHTRTSTRKMRNARDRSPDLGFDLVTLSEEEPDSLISAMRKKPTRKSLAAPPKRGPLQLSSRSHQTVTFADDVMGQGGGKENIPPGMSAVKNRKHIEVDEGAKVKAQNQRHPSEAPVRPEKPPRTLAESTSIKVSREASKKRPNLETSLDTSPAKTLKIRASATASTSPPIENSTRKSSVRKAALSSPYASKSARSPPQALRQQKKESVPSKLSVPLIVQKAQQQQEKYPALKEDLSRPQMYEDNWLQHQEVALTQLINALFDTAQQQWVDPDHRTASTLRGKLLKIYHDNSFSLLHKRLQASLMYGALSIPKDVLTNTLRLKDDLGLRRKFLNLWVDTYDYTVLKAALESVVGREIPVSSRLSGTSTSSEDDERYHRREKKSIENFIDTFLIRNEDAVKLNTGVGSITNIARGEHKTDDFGSHGWSWRRTVLKSLMLVLLLDKAKTTDTFKDCLFKTGSLHKSSTTVLQALAKDLLPSVGDITRPLSHLNYQVSCVQYPLEEYKYHIANMATDLRDGVVLTRIVELLLYTPSTLATQRDETVTVTMPSGELLTSAFDLGQKESWVLSKHLKLPSIGRAQKLYNVQIALSALEGVKGPAGKIAKEITAEDIVDGHRERTLSLLWGLVGKCGLEQLVDWKEVEREVAHFKSLYREQHRAFQEDEDSPSSASSDDERAPALSTFKRHTNLLQTWAASIACLKGLRVTNLTTSFTNNKVLEAIVDAYLPCFPSTHTNPHLSSSASTTPASSTRSHRLTLQTKLKSIGCSTAFISLLVPTPTRSFSSSYYAPVNSAIAFTPSHDFTLTSLAFLASRLLPAARAHRAATSIQRLYRHRLAKREVAKRVALMRLAHQCTLVVKTRARVVGAAVVLQRAWRRCLDRRIAGLVRDVTVVQTLVRGWRVRREVGRKLMLGGLGMRGGTWRRGRDMVRGGW
ncbi:hypothetical protein M501DRAFT_935141 [Patellaria atrata CBS 101060]|uniref:Calponin-homology (CH) domain-containing protein n=1 Tax=Patellaria atrata CBS 101060 TaxID=1346257 RepID=A0A9P4S9N2_9PEZI|nr:hypothetical protein M501DRAFT_935141 [Patellaria atrata CBS 101060]